MTEPFKLRWGIFGAGYISGQFVKDLILDPKTCVILLHLGSSRLTGPLGRRGVTDVVHEFTAIGSRNVAKAKEWIKEKTGRDDHPAKAYGSYEEVVGDPVR